MARAIFRSTDKRNVFLRTGKAGGAIYIDLGGADGRTVEVTAQGWHILRRSPVMFWRPRSMQPFPDPVRGGSLSDFFTFLNVPEEGGRCFWAGWSVRFVPTVPIRCWAFMVNRAAAKHGLRDAAQAHRPACARRAQRPA